jgi:hypothetical protein
MPPLRKQVSCHQRLDADIFFDQTVDMSSSLERISSFLKDVKLFFNRSKREDKTSDWLVMLSIYKAIRPGTLTIFVRQYRDLQIEGSENRLLSLILESISEKLNAEFSYSTPKELGIWKESLDCLSKSFVLQHSNELTDFLNNWHMALNSKLNPTNEKKVEQKKGE